MELASRHFKPQIVSKLPHLKLMQQTATELETIFKFVFNPYLYTKRKWQSNQLIVHLNIGTSLLFGGCVHSK